MVNIVIPPIDSDPQEHKMLSNQELHNGIINATTKAEIIAELMSFASSHGGFSGAPKEVWDKLKKAAKPKTA
jgi:hypothetical protein